MNNSKFAKYQLSRTPIPVLVFQAPSRIKHNSMASSKLTTTPPTVQNTVITFPTPEVLLVRLNRPESLNCINNAGHQELASLFRWLDTEPSLRCAIITGTGRAFCAGADLKEWNESNKSKQKRDITNFGGLSRRDGKKPVIAAVNGICFGGGCEMIINADIVVASEGATFALPEVRRGVVAMAGALTRLVRTVGRQRAMEMALTGRTVDAREAERWGFVNRVVGEGWEGDDTVVVKEAVKLAKMIAENSPDSVIVSREGIKLGWEGIGAEEGTMRLFRNWYGRIDQRENMVEGVKAFVEKREPRWVASKL